MGVTALLPGMVSTRKWLWLYASTGWLGNSALGVEYVEVLLVHGRELLDTIQIVPWRVFHLVLSDDHFVTDREVIVLHLVLVVG
jgi:hypothetical protein